MRELTEVEHTARKLHHAIVGATIHDALIFWERTIGHPDPAGFLAEIADRSIVGVGRRGKFLLVDLTGQLLLTIHRRMTGNLFLLPRGWEIDTALQSGDPVAWNIKGPAFRKSGDNGADSTGSSTIEESNLLYCRVCFNLADGRRLLFTDPRKFGRIELWPGECESEALKGLGPEPLSQDFTVETLVKSLSARKGAIKQVLLNQEVVAGLGNIYADEALFYASIHPLRRANTLTPLEIQRLHEGIVSVLTLGIEHGGASFNEYRDLWGEAGDNYNHVRVTDEQRKPRVSLVTPTQPTIVAQRRTPLCPGSHNLTSS